MVADPKKALAGAGRPAFPVGARQRDTRLDVLRAIALITIFINHVPGQVLERLTTKNFGFSDGAEAFVLISGIAVGLAYGGGFTAGNRLATSWRAVKRAFTLYLAHMITTFITLVLFICSAWLFRRPGLLCEINILAVLTNLKAGIPALLLLGHQIGYNNILPMYGALLLMVPGVLVLEAASPLLALGVAGGIWLLAGIYQIAPHNMLIEGFWFLNPLSWLFLFTIGIVAAMHVRRGGAIFYHPALLAAAAAYVALSFFWVVFKLWGIGEFLASSGLPTVISGFDKTFLSLPRLLHVLALAYLIVQLPALSRLLRRPADHPLVVLGRHSLNIFVAGTILAMVGQVILYIVNGSRAIGLLYVLAGLAAQLAYAYHLEQKRLQGQAQTNRGLAGANPQAVAVPARAMHGGRYHRDRK